jgi:hypothetical protein
MANSQLQLPVQIKTPTAVFAIVGAGDLVVERIRAIQVDRDLVQLQEQVTALPTRAQARVEAAVAAALGQASEAYGDLTRRGETLVGRIRGQQSTRAAVDAMQTTTSRAKATNTTARKAAKKTAAAAADAAQKVGD